MLMFDPSLSEPFLLMFLSKLFFLNVIVPSYGMHKVPCTDTVVRAATVLNATRYIRKM